MMRTSFASTSTRDASQHLSSLRFDIANNRVGGDAGEIGDVPVNDCLADDRLTAILV
jgi:hypothetical protein